MQTTELRHAYGWTCDNCGRDNFCDAVTWDGTDEDKLAFAKQVGAIEEYQTLEDLKAGEFGEESFDLLTMPDTVTCAHCKADYKATHPDQCPDVDDDE